MKLSRRRMNLKASDQVQFFKGVQTRLCTMSHSLLDVLLTSKLPLLVFGGVLSLRAEKIRFWRLENETPFLWWRHSPTVKRVRFLPQILHQSVHLCCRKVREHGEWFYIKLQTHLQSLRERTPLLFAISDKHSGRLLNFLCCFLYLELRLSWVTVKFRK